MALVTAVLGLGLERALSFGDKEQNSKKKARADRAMNHVVTRTFRRKTNSATATNSPTGHATLTTRASNSPT